MTHTYAVLEVSSKVYQEVRALLAAAGYEHAFIEGRNEDMHGIALAVAASEPASAPPPAETLKQAWERFSEEQGHAQVEIGPARKAFYAGAQTFVGIVSAAMEDEEDAVAWQRLEGTYEELSQACEEMKI